MSLINNRQVKFGGNFASLRNYSDKIIVKAIPFVTSQVLTVSGAQFKLVNSTILPGLIALGTTTTINNGIVAAALAGAVGTAATTSIADALGNVTNLVRIQDSTTGDPISYNDREVFGLIQAASSVTDGDSIGGSGSENLQISFVYLSSTGVLTLTAITSTIQFQVNKAFINKELPTYEFQGGSIAPDIIAPSAQSQKIATYLVTTGFAANETVNLVTGIGGASGVATAGGDSATVALGGSSGAFNSNNKVAVFENGVKQVKGTDFVYDSNTSGHFAIVLDAGDYFEVTFFA